MLDKGKSLELLGTEDVDMNDIVSEASSFISKCYGPKYSEDMSELRYSVWSTKMANQKLSSAPKLKSLPPTSDSFTEHVHRAHYQTMIWKSSLSNSPPAANPIHFGWTMKDQALSPVTLPLYVVLHNDVSPVLLVQLVNAVV